MATRSLSAFFNDSVVPARAVRLGLLMALLLMTAAAASAETLMMPKRDMLMGTAEVVWGVTTFANHTSASTTTYTINFGDGSANATGTVTDRSYIAVTHNYAVAGTFTATLQVTKNGTTETATVQIRVFNPAVIPDDQLRGVNINRAIENGLRYLWVNQANRAANFPAGVTTNWGGSYPESAAALIVLAFENHNYRLPNNDDAPTGIYEKYIVRRGLNFVIDELRQFNLTVQPAGDPCVNVNDGPAPCVGLRQNQQQEGYATSLAMLPLAGSNALNRTVSEITGSQNAGFVVGRTYGDVLQRLVNGMAWGQGESSFARGGWAYSFNAGNTDGSTIGWNVLALLDAEAAGITVPAFVKSEFVNFAIPYGLNNDGTFDYTSGNNPALAQGAAGANMAKNGIGVQAMFYADMIGLGHTRVLAGRNAISNRWNTPVSGDNYACANGTYNKGCGYAMFNVFKALKLQGITTLPGVTRPAGPGSIPAGDWYADYVDWLLTNQTSPTVTTGGHWQPLGFSCCGTDVAMSVALAELILSPVALIAPDPTLFSTVGLSPATALLAPGGTHIVTATATSAGGAAVAGATVNFEVLTGPNAGAMGQSVTGANGQATFSYNSNGAGGRDTIQAFIGTLGSNVVEAMWQVPSCGPLSVSITTSSMFPLDQGWRPLTINGAPGATVTQVCQDEPPNFENIAAWAVDAQGVGSSSASVRAQRSGTRTAPGNGRVYHIFFTASSCSGRATVGVPTVVGGSAVDNGPLYNSVTGATCAVPAIPTIVTAPSVVGDIQDTALARITGAGLTPGPISTLNSPTVPAGTVMSQSPAAGTNLAQGSAVAITVSSGQFSVAAPNVVGRPESVAEANITAAGLLPSIASVNDAAVAAGLVISQTPAGGTQVPPGSLVSVVVSLGPATSAVPNVVGRILYGAVNSIGGAGLNIGAVDLVYHPTIADGLVISQDPAPGTIVAPGSSVNFVLSQGLEPIPVPNVVGQPEGAAVAAVTAASFIQGTILHVNDAVVPDGHVVSQIPAGGNTATPGSKINLIVSSGPVMVTVPAVVGLANVPAQTTIAGAGLAVGTVTQSFNAVVPVGSVISQTPAGGASVPLGSPVNLTLSKGPAPITVPNLVGQQQAAATANLVAASLAVGTITETNNSTVPQGTVMGQSPAAGTPVPSGTAVNLLVSAGPVMAVVPNVVGALKDPAMAAVLAATLSVRVNYQASATVPVHTIISQSPAAGTSIPQGSFVDLIASSGPTIGVVPDVIGQTEAAASSALSGASLAVGTVTRVNHPTVPDGAVITQNPGPGSTVPVGSAVSLVVSLGPVMVTVPSVVGDTRNVATAKVLGASLGYNLTYAPDPLVPVHAIISQNPAGGTSVPQGTMVSLLASSGPTAAVVPNVVGQPRAAAESAIAAAGLTVGPVTQSTHATVPVGAVISQTPDAGSNAPPGFAVSLVVSTGPAVPSTVPNVVAQPRAAAEQAMTTAGFVVGTVTEVNDATVPLGDVISQTPAGGSAALTGSAVDLVVSRGSFIPGVPNSLELQISSLVLGSGKAVTVTSVVEDGFGTAVTPTPPITYEIVPSTGSSGPVPTLVGDLLSIGTGTRGAYTLRGTVDGTSVADAVEFVVINGSAQATNAAKFVKLGEAQTAVAGAIGDLLAAYQSVGTPADVTAARTALAATLTTVPITGRRAMQRSTAVAPEVGFLPTLGEVVAAGYPQTPHDAAFGNLINQLNTKLGQITAFYNALSPDGTAGGTDAVAQLNALNNQLAALQTQLVALNVTPHGIVRYAPQLNQLLGRTVPVYLHALANRAISIAQQYPDPASFPPAVARMPGSLEFFANLERMKTVAPGAFYGQTQPAFFGLGGLLGGMSIQMNLVVQIYGPIFNELAHILGVLVVDGLVQHFVQTVGIDIVSGASLSFHAPGLGGSHIESFVADPASVGGNETWFIGPEAFEQVQAVLESFDPSDVENIEDLWDFFNGIADAVGGAIEAYERAHTQGDDSIPNGCFLNDGGGCVATVFDSGFPDVNSTRFPSPVIVMIENLTTGNWGYGIFNFVP